jgi:hypothetical protein
MRLLKSIKSIGLISLLFSTSQNAHAHLMVAQHGTLNIVNNHVFVVLSIPASSIKGADDNTDGLMSLAEFTKYRKHISKQVKQHVYMSDQQYRFNIDGLLLNPELAHSVNSKIVDQITITGRYTPTVLEGIKFNINLFSHDESKQTYKITATNKQQQLVHQFELKPLSPYIKLF